MTESPIEHDETVDLSHKHTKRDADTLMALGLFMFVLSVPVLLGTLFEPRLVPEGLINIGAGGILMAIAVGFLVRGSRMRKRVRGDS